MIITIYHALTSGEIKGAFMLLETICWCMIALTIKYLFYTS
jgi:hypothetical protein